MSLAKRQANVNVARLARSFHSTVRYGTDDFRRFNHRSLSFVKFEEKSLSLSRLASIDARIVENAASHRRERCVRSQLVTPSGRFSIIISIHSRTD